MSTNTTEQSDDTRYVRLKPYNKRRGHLVRTYTYEGMKFVGERGWTTVSLSMGEKLKTLRQDENDPDSAKLFDVCTRAEADALEREEQTRTGPLAVADAQRAAVMNRTPAPRPATDRLTRRQSMNPPADNAETRGALREFDHAWDSDGSNTTVPPEGKRIPMLDPAPDGELDDHDEGRVSAVGRVAPVQGYQGEAAAESNAQLQVQKDAADAKTSDAKASAEKAPTSEPKPSEAATEVPKQHNPTPRKR